MERLRSKTEGPSVSEPRNTGLVLEQKRGAFFSSECSRKCPRLIFQFHMQKFFDKMLELKFFWRNK